MLIEFQQALADLAASAKFCISVREHPELLRSRYRLTEQEFSQLVSLVNHQGMECHSVLYREARLAPLVINLPKLCRALGSDLHVVASEYWSKWPTSDAHYLMEAKRFCLFLRWELARGRRFQKDILPALEQDGATLTLRLEANYAREGQTMHIVR
jgi:hypothetical protein